jgi:hypothetical protein
VLFLTNFELFWRSARAGKKREIFTAFSLYFLSCEGILNLHDFGVGQ